MPARQVSWLSFILLPRLPAPPKGASDICSRFRPDYSGGAALAFHQIPDAGHSYMLTYYKHVFLNLSSLVFPCRIRSALFGTRRRRRGKKTATHVTGRRQDPAANRPVTPCVLRNADPVANVSWPVDFCRAAVAVRRFLSRLVDHVDSCPLY